jgi:hypothetical protein
VSPVWGCGQFDAKVRSLDILSVILFSLEVRYDKRPLTPNMVDRPWIWTSGIPEDSISVYEIRLTSSLFNENGLMIESFWTGCPRQKRISSHCVILDFFGQIHQIMNKMNLGAFSRAICLRRMSKPANSNRTERRQAIFLFYIFGPKVQRHI